MKAKARRLALYVLLSLLIVVLWVCFPFAALWNAIAAIGGAVRDTWDEYAEVSDELSAGWRAP